MEHDNFIAILPRTSNDDLRIMQLFVYKIRDFNLAQKFDEALNKGKPFKNFRELMDNLPELREKWFEHRDMEIVNQTMNWLSENNIELEDKSFMPNIEIKELAANEIKLPEEFEGFGPIECMECSNKTGTRTRYFELNVSNENILIEKEIKRIMKKSYNIEDYGCIAGGDKDVLTYSECPKCKSTEIFEDF